MACVANRSTTVRNAVNPITTVRSRTLDALACISVGGEYKAGAACIMILSLVAEGCDAPSGASRFLNNAHASSHVVVALVVKDIAHEQNDGLVAEVLPPVRGAARLRPDIAGCVHDLISAVAGVFDDLALGDVDDRGAVAVAVPWHDAARLDRELAETQLAILDVRRLLLEVDGGEHRVGDALAGVVGRRAHVDFEFAGRAFAGGRRRHTGERRASRDSRQDDAATARDTIEHVRDLLCYAAAGGGGSGAKHSSDGRRTEMPIGSGLDSGLLWEEGSSTPDGAGLELLRRHARSDRGNDSRRHLELVAAVLDSVPPRDPVEIGARGPDLAFVVFEHEEPHRPVDAGIGIGADELRSERRITEDQEHRWMKLDASIGR